MSETLLVILMFVGLLIGLFLGHPLAFTLGGLAVIFGLIGWGPSVFYLFMNRIYGTMDNYVLIAIPLFVFMAQLLDQSGIAEDLFDSLRYLFGRLRGGVLMAVILVSIIFAACTGIIGASVVTMGLLSLPVLLKYGYQKEISTGGIAAGGTLGILIPPSIMLVVMAQQATLSVGELFAAAVFPGIVLTFLYLVYILVACGIKPEWGPPASKEELAAISTGKILLKALKSLLPPAILVLGVLGSIFSGVATPTEAAGLGAFLTFLMVIAYRKFTWGGFYRACIQTAKTNAMVIFILCGASCFTAVFLGVGGAEVVTEFIVGSGLSKASIFILMMVIVFFLGMFIDWLGIVLICFPIFLPISDQLGFNRIWFVIMIAVNLQASFLTPPFGYALFYLAGIAPAGVNLTHIYKGIIPFVILMLVGLAICAFFPELVLWLPQMLALE